MTVKLTVLSENTAGMGGFLAEWGLSLLLETGEMTVLLDTGTSITSMHNAKALDVDLGKIDKIVLSHGHSDHTGGLRDVLRMAKRKVEIIAHPDVWQAKYHRRKDDPERYIGIPFQRSELESLGAVFHLSKQPVKISENIMTTGEIPMVNEYETIENVFFTKEDSGWKPDELLDDQALLVKTAQGLVVLLGCAHRGMINTIQQAQKITGINEIYAVFGGSHLIGTSEERVWLTIAALRELNVQKLGLCHCTDLPVISILAQEFRDNFIFIKSGMRIDL